MNYCPGCGVTVGLGFRYCSNCGARLSGGAVRLQRNTQEGMLGGVAAGLADYLHVDVSLVRALLAVSALFFQPVVMVYLVLWLLIPKREPESLGE